MIKRIAIVIFSLVLFGCASKPEVWRSLSSDRPTVSIFIGTIKKAKHIARAGPKRVCPDPPEVGDDGLPVICIDWYLDPPPIKLTIEVEEQVYGAELGDVFFVNTTSHFGLDTFNIGKENKYLMLVLSDGITNILPKYHFEAANERYLSSDLDNEVDQLVDNSIYALPLDSPTGEFFLLPCEKQDVEKVLVRENKVGLYFFYNQEQEDSSYDDELFYRKATLKELIRKYKSLIEQDPRYHFKGETLYKSTYALSIKELKKRLQNYTQEHMLEVVNQEGECKN